LLRGPVTNGYENSFSTSFLAALLVLSGKKQTPGANLSHSSSLGTDPGRHKFPEATSALGLMLAVNGCVATIELKNPGTGQNWRDAVEQITALVVPVARPKPSSPLRKLVCIRECLAEGAVR
jgi:hypothetical protein